MRKRNTRVFLAGLMIAGAAGAIQATSGSDDDWKGADNWRERDHGASFQRVSTLANYRNNVDIGDETVSEIIAATRNGETLVYTDSPGEQIGFVDIQNPAKPMPAGTGNYDPEGIAIAPDRTLWVASEGNASDSRPNRLLQTDFAGNVINEDGLISNGEKSVYDLIPDLQATNGWITDKPEGVAITGDGRTFVVTDNDGVEDWSGEAWFLDLGRFWWLFR